MYKDGVHGDTSRTLLIGTREQVGDDKHYDEATHLLSGCHAALLEGIKQCKPGVSSSVIGHAVENLVDSMGLRVIPGLVGHGIGEYFHELPYISHTRESITDSVDLKEGMVFTIGT